MNIYEQLESENCNYNTLFSNEDYTLVGCFNGILLVWNNIDISIRIKTREKMKRMELYTEKCNVYYNNLTKKKRRGGKKGK